MEGEYLIAYRALLSIGEIFVAEWTGVFHVIQKKQIKATVDFFKRFRVEC